MPNLFSSLTTRIIMVLLVVFAICLAMIYWIIAERGKPEVNQLASSTVIETGNEAVNGLLVRMQQIDSMATTSSQMVGSLPKQAEVIEGALANVVKNTDSRIIGMGMWYEPTMFNPTQEQQAFVWERNAKGEMSLDPHYQAINPNTASRATALASQNTATNATTPTSANASKTPKTLDTPYHREWWYVPVSYANHDRCVWSRAYIHPTSKIPVTTCAKAVFNAKTNAFEGVMSIDTALTRLATTMQTWQEKTGGYVFMVDMDNNFLTFPNETIVKQVTANNPQGEMINVDTFTQQHHYFQPIAKSLNGINQRLITQAKTNDNNRFDFISNLLVSSTNLQRTTPKEAQILTAMLMKQGKSELGLAQDNFVEQVAVAHDELLNQPATAFIFSLPAINWKMVIVKPNAELTAFANRLGKQLQWYMLLGFLPILLLSAYLFRQMLGRPLVRMAKNMRQMGELIEQKRYLALTQHKLAPSRVGEINVISDAMNQLIDRVVENEGTLAQVNEQLELKVKLRTNHLQQAIKDLKASQVQLVQSEKMATLGQMVAGVAHEVNTPLGYVRSNLELIDDNLQRYDALVQSTQHLKQVFQQPSDDADIEHALTQTLAYSDELVADDVNDDLKALISDAQFGVGQISELVLSLKDFSRLDEAKIKSVNINDCIHSALTIARNNLKHLEVITELQAVSAISCNPSQINQVLLNLLNNASQAMPNQHDGKIKVTSFEDSDNVYIKVIDNGLGMPPEVMHNIFEPFFTTKPVGEGTGLGLAISAQIMEQHRGEITVESQQGTGTRFTLRLPKTSTEPHTAPKLAIEME
ncbi:MULTISPECIES: ATP-binding protein [unclassified Moraxella]|uniref:ATP-binding protein n=1 Tax=unclassified Moraxella TaxID=2685852 RepID=UPI003AF665A9